MGFCGVSHKAGTTLVSLAFANYLSGFRNYRIACLELNGEHAFSTIGHFSNRKPYRYLGIDFYANSSLTELTHLQTYGYDILVLDFGILTRGTLPAFLDCDLCLVLGYLSLWNRTCFYDWILTHQPILQNKELCYLANLGNEKDVRDFYHKYKISAIPVPFLENPFHLASCQFYFFERVMGKFNIPRGISKPGKGKP